MDLADRTARTFAVTMRWLPGRVGREIALAYLLARLADTAADAPGLEPAERLGLIYDILDGLGGRRRDEVVARMARTLGESNAATEGERALASSFGVLVRHWDGMDDGARARAQRVLRTILSGQARDVIRFREGSGLGVLGPGELEDYTWRVAGCVGEYWTEVLGARFRRPFRRDGESMRWLGRSFGQGLQLLNILRDAPEDWENGRCYLGVDGDHGRPGLDPVPPALHDRMRALLPKCRAWLAAGGEYADSLRSPRLRMAVRLPWRIGMLTWERMRVASPEDWLGRVKVPRREVKFLMWQTVLVSLVR